MARPIVLSNGRLHVGINSFGLVHDFYYPYVGLENHTIGQGLRHKVGVWVDGRTSWLDDGSWQISFSYPLPALIGHITAHHAEMQIVLEFDDTVDSEHDLFMRNIHVLNHADRPRDIRLFMHQAFVIGDSRGNTDTARYHPDSDALVHYRGDRLFVISGETDDKQTFDQGTVGLFGIEGREGTWRDAEDGELAHCTVEHGRVDSTLRFRLEIEAFSSQRVRYWIACGTTMRDALKLNNAVREEGVVSRLHQTLGWWHEWLEPVLRTVSHLPSAERHFFITSAMMVRSHIDSHGALIASTDSGMLNYGRDAYAYCWPRDGAYVLWPLIRMGYTEEPRKFFDFCRKFMHPHGYLMHKYRADGALGSSWHPYEHRDGIVAPPIQEDETALTLFVFAQFYQMHRDKELLEEYYESFIKPMAGFLASYVDNDTGLPKPTYDLWEEVFLTTTYTTAVTHAALLAAADLADDAGDEKSAVAWRAVADDMYAAAHQHFYDEERQILIKGALCHGGIQDRNITLDMSAVFGSFMFGLFSVDSREVTSSVNVALERFEYDKFGGLPRYENDSYRRESPDARSNIWHICTLWYAQYLIEHDRLDEAEAALKWVRDHSYQSNVLSEQIKPESGYSTSVAPLVWSHAEYMATVLDLINARQEP